MLSIDVLKRQESSHRPTFEIHVALFSNRNYEDWDLYVKPDQSDFNLRLILFFLGGCRFVTALKRTFRSIAP